VRFWQTVTCAFLVLIHAAPPAAILAGANARDWLALAVVYPVLAFGCTAGLHRYFAHRSFETSRPFQFAMALAAAAAFGDPIAFTARHRLHHARSDTERDVHGPHQGILRCWFGTLLDFSLTEREMFRLAPDLASRPELRWLHRYFVVPGIATAAAIWAVGGFSMFAIAYCGACLAIVHAGSAVNYFGHGAGTRRYDTPDRSSNHALVALVSLGEGWHNNHHHYPAACRAGFLWWEVDPLYYAIKLLSWMRIVWNLHEVPDRVHFEARARRISTAAHPPAA
jgi:stearoyl-CoA desaturase (delta-9 desaturase)